MNRHRAIGMLYARAMPFLLKKIQVLWKLIDQCHWSSHATYLVQPFNYQFCIILKRLQFSIQPALRILIKSQKQNIQKEGTLCFDPVFSDAQLYVALMGGRSWRHLVCYLSGTLHSNVECQMQGLRGTKLGRMVPREKLCHLVHTTFAPLMWCALRFWNINATKVVFVVVTHRCVCGQTSPRLWQHYSVRVASIWCLLFCTSVCNIAC